MTYEQCLKLTGEEWTKLTDEEKVEVLQTLENHVADENGRQVCVIEAKGLYTGTDGIALGSYDRNTGKIYVNSTQLASDSRYGQTSDRLVKTCFHEGRHAYQHQVVTGKIEHDNPDEVKAWKENFKNYISFKDNPKGYYSQPIEVDARKFADERYAVMLDERSKLEETKEDEMDIKDVFEAQFNETVEEENFQDEDMTVVENESDDESMDNDDGMNM